MRLPGGGLVSDDQSWTPFRSGFFLAVRALSRLFRRLFLQGLQQAFDAGDLHFETPYGKVLPLDMQANTCISFTTSWTSANVLKAMADARWSLP